METGSFLLQMNTENQLITTSVKSRRALELLVRAPKGQAQEKRAAINLALVLDRSGSMHGEKLDYVRQAAAHVLDLLAEGDRVAIVAYDDEVMLVAESAPITRSSRNDLKRRIAAIQSGGSTNLSDGWFRGCEQVALHMKNEPGGQVDRALLLTDGLANVGITDLEELAVHSRELAGRGISTSTFGVGEGYNEYLLESIAQQGRGSFYFIALPSDIPQIFTQEFEELSAITARDVEIELDLPAGVSAEVLGGLRFENAGRKLRISIGSLVGGYEQGVYLNLDLPPFSGSKELPFRAVARAKGLDGQVLEAACVLAYCFAEDGVVDAAPVRPDVLERAALVRISHAASEALKLEREGQGDKAAQQLEAILSAERKHLPPDQVNYHQDLAHRMRRGMQEQDRKSSHYSSYLSRTQRRDRTFQQRQGVFESGVLLERMMRDGRMRMHDSPFLRVPPAHLPGEFHFDRIEGMLLGLAVGDSLGNTSESLAPAERRSRFGEITTYLPNKFAGDQPVGVPSDDTQLAFWTVETLLDEGKLDPEALARRFSMETIFGIGGSMREFLRNFKDNGAPWDQAGAESAGNGALMRIAPVLLPHLKSPSSNLYAEAALAGMVTHNDYASNAACVAFAALLWEMLHKQAPPQPEWWVETYCQFAGPLEGQSVYQSRMPGVHYRGPVWQYARDEVARAMRENWTIEQASNRWGSGAYLLESVPNVLYILARHANDPEQAILRAVNDTYDNDTVAAIVGAVVGALHGKAALPERWLKGFLGRTNDHNDGHIFRLIEESRVKFWGR